LKHQIVQGLFFGIAGFLAVFFIPYKFWKKMAVLLLALSVFLLILVFTPLGFSHSGATRWINFGFATIQPAELLKLTFIIYLAAWLSSKKGDNTRQTNWIYGFAPFMLVCGIVGALIFAQPSTTMPFIILAAGLITYFASGARISFIIGAVLMGIAAVALFIFLSGGYRAQRIETYVTGLFQKSESTEQILDKRYHIDQARTAISSGGLWGIGFGKSTTKIKNLPEPIGDSIFAVIGEELGFAGASLTVAAFIVLIARGFLIAKNSRDKFAQLAVIGMVSVIAIQTFIHIGAISGVLPLTGVSLPFISYGGTSLAIFLTMSGLIAKISKYSS
jgi:cell division protein FtsW